MNYAVTYSNPAEMRSGWIHTLRSLVILLLALIISCPAYAVLPEPDNLIYGIIEIDGQPVTSAHTHVWVEARRGSPEGVVVGSYAMGSSELAGNHYTLAIPVEALTPHVNTLSSSVGTEIHVVVGNADGVKLTAAVTITGRGVLHRLDFARPDTDADGMPDDWELLYFGGATNGVAHEDTDGDGLTNLEEFLLGLNPLIVDARHPADIDPTDNRITIEEISAYIFAWKSGETEWPVPPRLDAPNIVDYVTRGGALWKGGEVYIIDNDPVKPPPLFWVNPPLPPGPSSEGRGRGALAADSDGDSEQALSKTTRELSPTYSVLNPLQVRILAEPSSRTTAYAVIESPPAGWRIRNISHQGRWDAVLGQIKWGPFFDAEERLLTYQATPIEGETSSRTFSGRGSFDGVGAPIAGAGGIRPAGMVHPGRIAAKAITEGIELSIHGDPNRDYKIEVALEMMAAEADWSPHGQVRTDGAGNAAFKTARDGQARFFRLRPVE